jgi:hypothetical protein
VKTPSARAINKTMLIVEPTRRRDTYSRNSNGNTGGFAGFFILRQFFDNACCRQ